MEKTKALSSKHQVSTEAKGNGNGLPCNSADHLSIGCDRLTTGDGMRVPSLLFSMLGCKVTFVERHNQLIVKIRVGQLFLAIGRLVHRLFERRATSRHFLWKSLQLSQVQLLVNMRPQSSHMTLRTWIPGADMSGWRSMTEWKNTHSCVVFPLFSSGFHEHVPHVFGAGRGWVRKMLLRFALPMDVAVHCFVIQNGKQ